MIYESIITTIGKAGRVHIAPMGVHEVDGSWLIAPFRPSTTLEYLRQTGVAVMNLTDDVRIFAGCLTGRRDWPTYPARKVTGHVLHAALAHRELEVIRTEDDPVRPRFYCKGVYEEMHSPFRGFNRAQAAVVEAAILVSRLDRLAPDKVDQEIEYLTIAIEKTAGESEREAWRWLMKRIETYRAE